MPSLGPDQSKNDRDQTDLRTRTCRYARRGKEFAVRRCPARAGFGARAVLPHPATCGAGSCGSQRMGKSTAMATRKVVDDVARLTGSSFRPDRLVRNATWQTILLR